MWWPNGAGTTRPVAGLEPGTYYWQARAQTGSQWSDANGGTWWSFTVGTPAVSFSKLTPAPGAILTSNAALLSWSAVEGASFYEVCVDTVNNQLCDAAWISNALSTVRTLTGLTDGAYYWQVRVQTTRGRPRPTPRCRCPFPRRTC